MRPSVLLAASAVVLTLVFTSFCSDDENSGMFPECGDGILDAGEECDDGNIDPGDGCRAGCTLEECGDGILDTGEECDDGNIDPGDGCDVNCALEDCGDGNLDVGEVCDDGNDVACDGCSPQCTLESGVVCGDGTLNQACGEECDDGNNVACDGCSPQCVIEAGVVCGDGILNQACGEGCDDGNTAPGDGCDENCMIEPLLAISGDYDLNINPVFDTCGFGASPTATPMAVNELDPMTVEIDIPVGGVGGDCDRKDFTRAGDTVTRVETIHGQIGACIIQTNVTTQFTFFADDSVTGLETNVIQASGGDCSAVSLPCTVELEADGARCIGCFACVNPTAGTSGTVMGPLGGGAGKGTD